MFDRIVNTFFAITLKSLNPVQAAAVKINAFLQLLYFSVRNILAELNNDNDNDNNNNNNSNSNNNNNNNNNYNFFYLSGYNFYPTY